MKITHLTSAHPRGDTRIFIKQCCSLVSAGFFVSLVVADDKGDEIKCDVKIFDVGHLSGRINRMFSTTQRVFNKALALDSDIYHLHDPELIPIGLKLKHLGKLVIFDAHEDVASQLLGKPYLGPLRLRALAGMFSLYERYACRRFDGIVAATPYIREKFLPINSNTMDVNNFPVLGELETSIPWDSKQAEVCYVGGISAIRGIQEIITAMSQLPCSVRLNLAGCFSEPAFERSIRTMPGWQQVNELGFVNRLAVRDVMGRSVAGLVTLHPVINYLDALPVKMFEYMAAGIPPIASNFPLWRDIIESHDCGLCVDPLDPAAIARAIDYLVTHPDEAQRMGNNGRRAVLEKYNWSVEEAKLLCFYNRVQSGSQAA